MNIENLNGILKGKKKLIWGIGIIAVILVMIFMDRQKVYKLEKPPVPTVTVGAQTIQAELGTYRWNGEKVEKSFKDIMQTMEAQTVDYRETLEIDFPENEKPVYIARGYQDYLRFNFDPFTSLMGEEKQVLGNHSNVQTYALKAYWKNGKRAEYFIPLHVREVQPVKPYHAYNKGFHSLLIVADDEQGIQKVTEEIYSESPNFLMSTNSLTKLEDVRNFYPELKIEKSPIYVLFDHEKEIFRSTSLEELKAYIREHSYEKKETVEGTITKIDREFGIINLEGTPLFVTDISTLKVGQKISLDVTTINEYLPYYKITENVRVLDKPDKIALEKKWLSKKNDKFSILVIGDSEFTKLFKSPHKEDLKLVENITIEKPSKNNSKPVIYVFNDKELVYLADSYDSLLKFLFEAENLLLLKETMPNG